MALKTSFHSSFHTVADASHDVQKMVTHLLEERAISDTGRTGTEFECPLKKGSKKMGSAFQNFLNNICVTLHGRIKEAARTLRKQDPALPENRALNRCEVCFKQV